jgi:carbamoylphosphate synthase large subunit
LTTRVLLTEAGTVPSNNLVRSLRAAGDFVIVGCSVDRFVLKKSDADRKYLVPVESHPAFVEILGDIVCKEGVDLLIPTSDPDVWTISQVRDQLPCRIFLPRAQTIQVCQDKYELTTLLRSRGIPAPRTVAVTTLGAIDELFECLGGGPLWCRLRVGCAGRGASFVRTPAEAREWIHVWRRHGVPETSFTLSEFLPGRDYGCQSLWRNGELVLAKALERLSYLPGPNHPSAVASLSALAKTTADRRIVDLSTAAVRAIDQRATGVFGVDLRADGQGVPMVTEINAGRMYASMNLLDLTGVHNMAAIYVKLALGQLVQLDTQYELSEDYYIVRGVDAPAGVFHADELFEGIDVTLDARQSAQ